MSNKKILCTIGFQATGEHFMRFDVRTKKNHEFHHTDESNDFYFEAEKIVESYMFSTIEIINNKHNRDIFLKLIKELKDDKIQDNPERP